MTGPQTKGFLEKFVKLTGEVTNLHGRRELSKDGYELMRNMLREAMDGLSEPRAVYEVVENGKKKVYGTDPAKKAAYPKPGRVLPPRLAWGFMDNEHWNGYLRSDLIACLMARYDSVTRSLVGDVIVLNTTGLHSDLNKPDHERVLRASGLRRPDEPDYKPLA